MTEEEKHKEVMDRMRIDTVIKTVGMLISGVTLLIIVLEKFVKK